MIIFVHQRILSLDISSEKIGSFRDNFLLSPFILNVICIHYIGSTEFNFPIFHLGLNYLEKVKRSRQCWNVELQCTGQWREFNGQSMATFVDPGHHNDFATVPICAKPSIMYKLILLASLKQYIFTRTKL